MGYKYVGTNHKNEYAYVIFTLYSPNKIKTMPTRLNLIKHEFKLFVLDNEREI